MSSAKPFTGRKRRRKTLWTVLLIDRLAKVCITVGGIGAIVAILAVFVFLVRVVAPLTFPAEVGTPSESRVADGAPKLHTVIDEYRLLGWRLSADGTLETFRFDTLEPVDARPLADGGPFTAAAFTLGDEDVALGFADGSMRLGTIDFETSYLAPEEIPPDVLQRASAGPTPYEGGMLEHNRPDQFRHQRLVTSFHEPIALVGESIHLLDFALSETDLGLSGGRVAAVTDGKLHVISLAAKKNLLTRKVTFAVDESASVPLSDDPPQRVLLAGRGDTIYLIWDTGRLLRFDARDISQLALAEEVDLVDGDARLTAAGMLLGRSTLICGDSRGQLAGWFQVRPDNPTTADGMSLVRAKPLPPLGAPITALGMGQRNRLVAAGTADGRVAVMQVTTEHKLAEVAVSPDGLPVDLVGFAPKDDGLFAATASRFWRASFDPKHSDATLGSLFGPVWYEDYNKPEHVWQSSGGTVDLEMKLGLRPLIFGTLKATFYAMLFGAPLALLAALYTSEFLGPKARTRIKPAVEMMASLPSVVLGFLAALVFAERIERMVPAVLCVFATLPLAILSAAYVWQVLPRQITVRLERFRLLCILAAALPAGLAAAWFAGPLAERAFFHGDIMRWLDGRHSAGGKVFGAPTGGWMILLLPLCALVTAVFLGYRGNAWLRQRFGHLSERAFALIHCGKFAVAVVFTFAVACSLSSGLSWLDTLLGGGSGAIGLSLDPRGTFLDTYVQRNALVVGFVMGFAVIPIIYTIAEDALSGVPEHLRSASLGAGATPWQTAVRIVIPTAMSGLFSAIMIGLGRVVGETMIVLMAGGNTPEEKWNVFSGFRTLSANIAVELPEAVQDSTHFRTLYLAALTLFALTFVVNTVAEMVRLRVRRKYREL